MAGPSSYTSWTSKHGCSRHLPADSRKQLEAYMGQTVKGAAQCLENSRLVLFYLKLTTFQPRCPSADEWIRKLWYIDTMEYHSAIKNNSFESVLMRWMKLEPIIQSEVSQKDKEHYSILTHKNGI